MAEFIGRRRELKALNSLYHKDGFQMMVLYGRRRVGKSTLLQRFIEDKKAVFYTAVRSSSQRNLMLMGDYAIEALAPEMRGVNFSSYEDFFSWIGEKAQQERIIFIIDEFPYLAEQDKSLLSVLQKFIDREWLDGNMFLILSGSSISFMEDEVLSEKSPLFGRRTSQMKLKAFNYMEAAEFVLEFSAEDKAVVYGVTGGIAKYLSMFDDRLSLDDNLKQLFFAETGYLYEEPNNLLTQEFKNVALYNAIIEAVAAGRNKISTIADLTHMDSTKVSHAAANLVATGILRKDYAITDENNKRKVQYVLADNMFRFWYQFVSAGVGMIDFGRGAIYYDNVVKKSLPNYMGSVFEDMCRYYTMYMGTSGRLACLTTKVGKWWGTNPAKKEETDIDVVGIDSISKQAVIGECKFKNEVLDKGVFEQLKARHQLIDKKYTVVQYLLFSKSGFSDWILKNAEQEHIYMVDLEQMYEPDEADFGVSQKSY